MKGTGAQYDYGFRIYDPRVGRFLSVDPLTASYPWYTPYQFAGNNPIQFIDLDGLEQALPKQPSKKAILDVPTTNVAESTCQGCGNAAKQFEIQQFQQGLDALATEAKQWRIKNPGKPIPEKYKPFINEPQQPQFKQGGYLGSKEYIIAKANWDTYGKYLPGLSDLDDLATFANAVADGKVEDATIFAVAFLIPEVNGKVLKGPLHHIFSNKNFIRGQQWSKKFEPLFEKAGYKLNDAINKIEVIGHKGPHPDEYHQVVFDRLTAATKGLEGEAYKKAFDNTLEVLTKEVSTAGTQLNKLVTKQ